MATARAVRRCVIYPAKRIISDPLREPGVHAHSGRALARPGFVLRCRGETYKVVTQQGREFFGMAYPEDSE